MVPRWASTLRFDNLRNGDLPRRWLDNVAVPWIQVLHPETKLFTKLYYDVCGCYHILKNLYISKVYKYEKHTLYKFYSGVL